MSTETLRTFWKTEYGRLVAARLDDADPLIDGDPEAQAGRAVVDSLVARDPPLSPKPRRVPLYDGSGSR